MSIHRIDQWTSRSLDTRIAESAYIHLPHGRSVSCGTGDHPCSGGPCAMAPSSS